MISGWESCRPSQFSHKPPLIKAFLAAPEHYRQLAERSRIDLANNAFGSVRTITNNMLARRFGQNVQLEKIDARGYRPPCFVRKSKWRKL